MAEPTYKSYPPIAGYALILIITAIALPVMLTQDVLLSNPIFRWTVLLSALWAGALFVVLFFLLRSVEAYADHLVIHSWRGTEDIAFADIEWVMEFTNRKGPAYLCLKYRDKAHEDFRLVLCMPKRDHVAEESALAIFIRQQIMKARPEYSRDAEPSPWGVYIALILSALVLHPLAKFLATV